MDVRCETRSEKIHATCAYVREKAIKLVELRCNLGFSENAFYALIFATEPQCLAAKVETTSH